jgi:hypothetical protein
MLPDFKYQAYSEESSEVNSEYNIGKSFSMRRMRFTNLQDYPGSLKTSIKGTRYTSSSGEKEN